MHRHTRGGILYSLTTPTVPHATLSLLHHMSTSIGPDTRNNKKKKRARARTTTPVWLAVFQTHRSRILVASPSSSPAARAMQPRRHRERSAARGTQNCLPPPSMAGGGSCWCACAFPPLSWSAAQFTTLHQRRTTRRRGQRLAQPLSSASSALPPSAQTATSTQSWRWWKMSTVRPETVPTHPHGAETYRYGG